MPTPSDPMPTCVLVTYYSTYGHTWTLAQAVQEGAGSIADTDVRLRRIPELAEARKALQHQDVYNQIQEQMADIPEVTHDDLRWADGVAWGTPTRYGNMAAQVKQFLDTTGALWQNGELEDKATGVFVSTSTQHGGHESTILATHIPLLHLGMVIVGSPYGQNPGLFQTDEVAGGSPYGPGTVAGGDGTLQPKPADLDAAHALGRRIARVAAGIKSLRDASAPPHAETYAAG